MLNYSRSFRWVSAWLKFGVFFSPRKKTNTNICGGFFGHIEMRGNPTSSFTSMKKFVNVLKFIFDSSGRNWTSGIVAISGWDPGVQLGQQQRLHGQPGEGDAFSGQGGGGAEGGGRAGQKSGRGQPRTVQAGCHRPKDPGHPKRGEENQPFPAHILGSGWEK